MLISFEFLRENEECGCEFEEEWLPKPIDFLGLGCQRILVIGESNYVGLSSNFYII